MKYEVVSEWSETFQVRRAKIRITKTKKIAYIHWQTGPPYLKWFADKNGKMLNRRLLEKEFTYVK